MDETMLCPEGRHDLEKCRCRRCGAQLHEWRYGEYYCAFVDGYSARAFDCETCGDLPTCGGATVRRVCARCGLKEWVECERSLS